MRRLAQVMMVAVGSAVASFAGAQENWPQWRGPTQQGHVESKNLPIQWSESEHVRWKTAIPGRGWSSPVIWGEQVWMTTATEEGRSLRAVCLDKGTGKVVHDVEVFHVPQAQRINPFNSHASPSPVIEEGRVYVCFGSDGSACVDTKTGEVVWKNTELSINHMEGPGSTPVLYKDLYILHCDGSDEQYVAALNKTTGKMAWKTPRATPFPWYVIGPLRKAYGTPH